MKHIYIILILLSAPFYGVSQFKVKAIPKNIPKVNINQIKVKTHANSNTIVGTKKVHPKYDKKPGKTDEPVDKKKTELNNEKEKEPAKKKK